MDYADNIGIHEATSSRTDKSSVLKSRREMVQQAIAKKYIIAILILTSYSQFQSLTKEKQGVLMMLFADQNDNSYLMARGKVVVERRQRRYSLLLGWGFCCHVCLLSRRCFLSLEKGV